MKIKSRLGYVGCLDHKISVGNLRCRQINVETSQMREIDAGEKVHDVRHDCLLSSDTQDQSVDGLRRY
jgi:hypothetical protein